MGKEIDTELEDLDVEDLEVEEDVDVETDDEDTDVETDEEDEDDDDSSEDDDEEPSKKKSSKGEVKFTKEQKAVIEDMVQSRLDRAERQLNQRIRGAAGVDVNRQEVMEAANLWGFLKLNPKLSENVQRMIDEYIVKGDYVKQDKSASSRESELGKREAILDLKAEDPYFARHSKAILEWAEDEDFDIHDAKSLKRAYLAYKGSRKGVLDRADKEHRKKQQDKTPARKQPKVAMTKKGNPGGKRNTDYSKMSDGDLLASMGKSLFTDD